MRRLFLLLFALLLVPASGACAGWWNLAASSGAAATGCTTNPYTNSLSPSSDLTGWSQTGTSVSAYNAVGLNGDANTATTLTDDSSGLEYVNKTVTKVSGQTDTIRWYIKKDADTSRFPAVVLGDSSTSRTYQINTSTGAIVQSASAGTVNNLATEVIDNGLFWEILLQGSWASTALVPYTVPADGTVWGTRSNAATGSCIIGNVEVYLNKTIDDIRGLCPVFTP